MSVIEAIEPHLNLIREASRTFDIPADLIAAVIYVESSGNQYAVRPEPGFWRRYFEGIKRFVLSSKSTRDDNWFKYPDFYSSSYGLMQVLYQTAREMGFDPRYPTELCGPMGVQAGCTKLKKELVKSGGNYRPALLAYNGGSDAEYPVRVMNALRAIQGSTLFR